MDWFDVASEAVREYRAGRSFHDFPPPGSVSLCAKAAHALFTLVTRKPLPFAQKAWKHTGVPTALDMYHFEHAAADVVGPDNGANAYHRALGLGNLKPGCRLYWRLQPEEPAQVDAGHVATVVRIGPEAATSLSDVLCFENTSSRRNDGHHGTRMTRLDIICQAHAGGSDSIIGVGCYGV